MLRLFSRFLPLLILACLNQALADISVPVFGSRGDVPSGLTVTFSEQLRRALKLAGLQVSPAELITAGIAGSLDPLYTELIAELGGTRYAVSGEIAVASGHRQGPFVVNLLIIDLEQHRHSDVISRPFAFDGLRSVAGELAGVIMAFTDQSAVLPAGSAGLFLSSEPGDAEVYLNGLLIGRTSQLEALQLQAGRYRIELRKDGFLPEMRVEELRNDSTKFVHVPLTAITGGSIQITSSPRAEVFLGDTSMGFTPITVPARSGMQQVRLERPGFRPQTVPVLVRNNRVNRLDVRLAAEREPMIFWQAEAGDRVFLNGLLQREGLARALRPGRLDVEVRRAGEQRSFSILVPLTGAYELNLNSGELQPRGQ
jgi:hypothetical protein